MISSLIARGPRPFGFALAAEVPGPIAALHPLRFAALPSEALFARHAAPEAPMFKRRVDQHPDGACDHAPGVQLSKNIHHATKSYVILIKNPLIAEGQQSSGCDRFTTSWLSSLPAVRSLDAGATAGGFSTPPAFSSQQPGRRDDHDASGGRRLRKNLERGR